MRQAPSTLHFSYAFRPAGPAGGIEWEELPSLAGRLEPVSGSAASLTPRAPYGQTVWDSTRPAELEPAIASGPFREPMDGMAVREVVEPDVFRHFFGR